MREGKGKLFLVAGLAVFAAGAWMLYQANRLEAERAALLAKPELVSEPIRVLSPVPRRETATPVDLSSPFATHLTIAASPARMADAAWPQAPPARLASRVQANLFATNSAVERATISLDGKKVCVLEAGKSCDQSLDADVGTDHDYRVEYSGGRKPFDDTFPVCRHVKLSVTQTSVVIRCR